MSTSSSLRAWLRKRPHPTRVRVDDRIVAVPDSPRKWSELEETIESLGWSKVEALSVDGEVIRAKENDDDEPAETTEAAKAGRLGEIAQIAHELRECVACVQSGQSDTWAKVVQAAYDLAHKMSESWSRSERELAIARARIVELETELASADVASSGDVGTTLINAMAQGKAAAEAKKAAAAKTNGATVEAAE